LGENKISSKISVAKIKSLKEKVLEVVKKIREGEVMSYKEVAEKIGKPKAYRFVANVLMKNNDLSVPCHRVVKNDYGVGEYNGLLFKNKNTGLTPEQLKLALLLKEGVIAVMPTDTIYGICASAFNKKAVQKVYKLRKRNPKKPCIILISKIENLKLFGIKLTKKQKEILQKIWLGKVSVILEIDKYAKVYYPNDDRMGYPNYNRIIYPNKNRINHPNENRIDYPNKDRICYPNLNRMSDLKNMKVSICSTSAREFFRYLHRGTNTLAFRLPKGPKWLLKVLEIFGPLIAPSANWESYESAKTINEAKKYFGKNVVYYDGGKIIGEPSTLIKLNKKIEILRKGSDWSKIIEFAK
jgi:O-6-methylguanine DNA methyltransferase